ncbi:T6SS effector BTH_I2691 family protein [Burkholderia sp. S171]|uniref:T6SS effector BTH_I2691 family protein n=1 Tax=Burkholderia sp. S171 TaxID=1641860 RepID=UPI00265CD16D|nr:T6SS effector BTH_I2691 family protein [Burkholderia sp. S171]
MSTPLPHAPTPKLSAAPTKCANCEKAGLPILPVRYTVVPRMVSASMPEGIGGEGVSEIALTQHSYGLRTLRAGWVYLFYVKGARGNAYWEAYEVTEDGRLWKQSMPLPAVAVTHPACVQKDRALPMDIIAIEQPHKCTEVYIAFSEHKWLDDTFKRYAADAALRKQRMQRIEPAKWIGSAKCTSGHATKATAKSIDKVVEYMPGLNPEWLQPSAQQLSAANGAFAPALLSAETTRYSLHVRQATPDSASTALVDLMNGIGRVTPSKSHPPMLLALWDGIGNVHELNGFRNDANGRLVQYYNERGFEIDAIQAIDAAQIVIRQGAVAFKSKLCSGFQAGLEAMIQTPPNSGYGVTLPRSLLSEEMADSQQRIKDAGKISASEAQAIGEAAWPKYDVKLNHHKLNAFRDSLDKVQGTVRRLQAQRTPDIAAWLGAAVFLHTLSDYDEHQLSDGIAFEKVIAEGLFGLGSESEGADLLDKLVARIKPTLPDHLFWRAIALNQAEPRRELEKALAAAQAHKQTPLEVAGDGASQLVGILEQFKTFTAMYEKFNGLAHQAQPTNAREKAVQDSGVDKLMSSAGAAVFKWLHVDQLGDFVGEKVVHGLCLVRAGIPQADMKSLLAAQAKIDGPLRVTLMSRWRQLRAIGIPADAAFMQSAQELAATEGSKTMRAKWASVMSGKGSVEVHTGMRIATVVLLIEAASFAKLLAKSDKTSSEYAALMASGLSVVGATLQLALPLKSIFGEASQSAGVLKALGGFAGAGAACIGAMTDGLSARDAGRQGHHFEASLYAMKGFIGLTSTGANLFIAVSSSAPLIQRLAGRKGYVMFLEKVATGISDAAARQAAIAAGEVVVEVVGERAAMMAFGRAVLFLAGWEVMVAVTVIQGLIWYLSDDELQTWFEKCAFGIAQPKPLWTEKQQSEAFAKALQAVGLSTQGRQ